MHAPAQVYILLFWGFTLKLLRLSCLLGPRLRAQSFDGDLESFLDGPDTYCIRGGKVMQTLNQSAAPAVQRLLHLKPDAGSRKELEDIQEQEQIDLAVEQKVDGG